NGRTAALRRTRDSRGHALAQWQGCRVLASGELFLLGDATDCFDARFWGAIPGRFVEGVWRRIGAGKPSRR
ncbi:MAG TPA: S26 family signal peptidase, partial [Caulobacterales bacterium]|nr:S26 family signal peptidase [Caulobacterales bacterium]